MRLGRVIGNVVSVVKHEKLAAIKLIVVEPIDEEGKAKGPPHIMADYLNAADGNIVFWIEDGSTICKWVGMRSIPLRGCVVGIVDQVDMHQKKKVLKG
jgi:ethanolamine utilization protein EutN